MAGLDDVMSLSVAEMRRLMQANGKEDIEQEVERARALSSVAMGAIAATNAQLAIVRTYITTGATSESVEKRMKKLLGDGNGR